MKNNKKEKKLNPEDRYLQRSLSSYETQSQLIEKTSICPEPKQLEGTDSFYKNRFENILEMGIPAFSQVRGKD